VWGVDGPPIGGRERHRESSAPGSDCRGGKNPSSREKKDYKGAWNARAAKARRKICQRIERGDFWTIWGFAAGGRPGTSWKRVGKMQKNNKRRSGGEDLEARGVRAISRKIYWRGVRFG